MSDVFDEAQLAELRKPLDPKLTKERDGAGGKKLKYIEGHTAIATANRIFGHGNWGYDLLYCKMETLLDPLTGEAVGVAYKAAVRLQVRDCIAVTDVGSQPVASWNVNEVIMSRRKKGDDSPIKDWEVAAARRTITESHEQAEKGAVTDAVKRALRTYGSQFANDLYGDGKSNSRVKLATAEQVKRLRAYGKQLGYDDLGDGLTFEDADQLLREWVAEYNKAKTKTA